MNNKNEILEEWLEQTTNYVVNYKISKLAKNEDVIIYTLVDTNLTEDNVIGSFVYFYKSKKIQECETFEGAMHLYFY